MLHSASQRCCRHDEGNLSPRYVSRRQRSEDDFHSQIHAPRRSLRKHRVTDSHIRSVGNCAERTARDGVVDNKWGEIGAIEEIERLCANVESHFFGDANSAKMQTSNNAVKNGVLKNLPALKLNSIKVITKRKSSPKF